MVDHFSCIFTLIHLKSLENNINKVKTRLKQRSIFSIGQFVSTDHLAEVGQTCTENQCFEQNQKNIKNFQLNFFSFYRFRKICILQGHVFVMKGLNVLNLNVSHETLPTGS